LTLVFCSYYVPIVNPWLWSLSPSAPILLFFAVMPPRELWPVIGGLCERLCRAQKLGGRPIGLERLHITLAPVFHEHLGLEERARRAIAVGSAMARPSFAARLDLTASFAHRLERKPFVLSGQEGLAELIAFQSELRRRMALAGFKVRPDYQPHMTLMWADHQVEEEYPVAPISWQVRDFMLIASHQGLSRYDIIRRWSLQSLGEGGGGQKANMSAVTGGIPAAGLDQLVP
jgi:2'-5' RNA ligase